MLQIKQIDHHTGGLHFLQRALYTDGFHLITAVEVIEHVENYIELLRDMSNLLHPTGEVILTVPYNWDFRVRKAGGLKLEPMYGHLWKFDKDGLKKDLQHFFEEVKVESIYSRTMDRRLMKVISLFPLAVGHKLSRIFVKHQNNGAWLMAVAHKRKDDHRKKMNPVPAASAEYYKDSPLFSDT